MNFVTDVGINYATEALKLKIVEVINESHLPLCCIRMACKDVMNEVEASYTQAVQKERDERIVKK